MKCIHTTFSCLICLFSFLKRIINCSRIYINLMIHLFFWNECEIKKHSTTLFNNFLCIFIFEFAQPIKNIKNYAALVSSYREWHESVKMVSFELLVTVTCHTFFENMKKAQFKEIVPYTFASKIKNTYIYIYILPVFVKIVSYCTLCSILTPLLCTCRRRLSKNS